MMRNDDRTDDQPPYSRLFVVCSKSTDKDALVSLFEKYGHVEKIHMPRDRNTGESKGIAYIKYSKTSSAAAAIKALHMSSMERNQKPIKVMVSSYNKSEEHNENEEKYKRLFIKVSRDTNEEEMYEYFSKFGDVVSVHLVKDKSTAECKGFAYVNYSSFLDAATAFEECDRKYKAIFATPKDELKRTRNNYDHFDSCHSSNSNIWKDHYSDPMPRDNKKDITSLMKAKAQGYDTVIVTCTPNIEQKFIEKLFNVIPGMMQVQYSSDILNGYCKASIKYSSEIAAAHACETLNNFEFPSGNIITVKPDDNPITKVANNLSYMVNSFKNSLDSPNLLQLADAIEQASSLIKAATSGVSGKEITTETHYDSYCNVILPPPQPLAEKGCKVVQRCFLVFKPGPPPLHVLKDVFCRFGDLIDIILYPKKTFGFARYASSRAAEKAMITLNGAKVGEVRLKVLEATEKDLDHDLETKRAKMDMD